MHVSLCHILRAPGWLCWLLGLSVPKKSGNDGFTCSISASSKDQVGDEKVPSMTVFSLVLEQLC